MMLRDGTQVGEPVNAPEKTIPRAARFSIAGVCTTRLP